MTDEVVRRLSLTFAESGADATTAKFNKLTEASNNLATVTDTNAKRALSAQAAMDKLTLSIDDAAAAQAKIEKGTKTLNAALAQGVITQDQYNESLKLLKEKYSDAGDAGEEASKGFALSGIEAASVANHVKQAALALYALSPAFRAIANPAIAAGLSATGSVLAAMSPYAAALAVNLAGRVLPLLTQVAALALPFALLNAEIKLIGFAWNSASEQIEKYNNLANQNKNTGVDADFFQRMVKGSESAKIGIDAVTASLKKFKEVSDEKLGGSVLGNKIDAHIDADNLNTNTGVEKYSDAVGPEAKYRAIVELLRQMTAEGRQLAAIDIASTFASPEQLEEFRRFPGYFQEILEKADKIAATKLVSSTDIAGAQELKNRYEEAVRILSDRWIPFQDKITEGGLFLQRIWVSIVETIAAAVKAVSDIGDKIANIKWPSWISSAASAIGGAAYRTVTPSPVQGAIATANYLGAKSSSSSSYEEYQPFGKYTGTQRPDNSNDLKKQTTAQTDANDAVDRAINSARKHVLAQEADAKAIGLGAAALAAFRIEAQETAAVQANGDRETSDQATKFAALKVAASEAAVALEQARINSDISRGKQLAFATPQDVQIANQLRGLYGDDIPAALASSEAAALRMNNTMKGIADIVRDAASSFAKDLIGGLVKGNSLMSSLGASARSLSTSLTNGAITSLFKGDFVAAGLQGIGAIVTGIFGADQEEEDNRRKAAQEAEEKRLQKIEDVKARKSSFEYDASLSAIDTDTIAGQIQAFDVQSNKARADEMKAGGEAILELEKKLATDRQAIVDKANRAVVKSYNDFLASIKTGSLSTLSPEDQLRFAQSQFNRDVESARGGDQDAIDRVTKDAQSLLDIAKGFYASSSGYATIYNSVTSAIEGLANSGGIQVAADTGVFTQAPKAAVDPMDAIKARLSGQTWDGLVEQAQGYDVGGFVMNGRRGVDSVTARLAGGEHVTRTGSVNASTAPVLSYINRTGQVPGGDNAEVVRVLTQGFNGQTEQIVSAIETLSTRVKSLEDTTRQTSNQRRIPGSTQKAA